MKVAPMLFQGLRVTERCRITGRNLSQLCWNQQHEVCGTIACTCLCHDANPVEKEGEDD